MFPNYHCVPTTSEITLRPDRRPIPGANEIRLRVKQALNRQEA